MWKEFKSFILRDNILELAVAVIIAGAFSLIVSSFTNDIILPPIGLLLGDVNFSELALTLKAAEMGPDGAETAKAVTLNYGKFIQTILDFLIIAAAIFMVMKAYERTKKKPVVEASAPAGPTQEQLLTEIRDLLKK
jgi:large conductance mechanosensitive channel